MKYCIGILNWNRDLINVLNSLKNINNTDIIICTNNVSKYITSNNNLLYNVIEASKKITTSKNNIIKKARELGYNYLFILEDDVIVKDTNVFNLYIEKMREYNLGYIYYGFHHDNNRLLGVKPNPSVEIRIDDFKKEIFTRFACSAVVGINLDTNNNLFDEDLWVIDLDEYIYRCHKNNNLSPFSAGFNIDINNSWNYFEYDSSVKGSERFKSQELADMDKKSLNEKYKGEFNLEVNVDKLLKKLGELHNIEIIDSK